ncbi:MAG: aspartate aminotransferase, partial [Planctomycetota bacterium]
MDTARLVCDRGRAIDTSGIRKVFQLAATLKDPINLSIGQPDFAVPDPIKHAAIEAIEQDRNGYTASQGIPQLIE